MADTQHLDPSFRTKLQQLIAESGGRLSVSSGFRSVAEQQKLWDDAVKKYGSAAAARKWVAPPGDSHHNKGVAADLSGDLAWAHANAARFGLHFPMPWEAWHIEPADLKSTSGHTTPPDGLAATGVGNAAVNTLHPDNAQRLADVADQFTALRQMMMAPSGTDNFLAALNNLVSGNPSPAPEQNDLVDRGQQTQQNDLVDRGAPVTADPLVAQPPAPAAPAPEPTPVPAGTGRMRPI